MEFIWPFPGTPVCSEKILLCFDFANGSLLIAERIIISCSQFYHQDKFRLSQLSALQDLTSGLLAPFCFSPPATPAAISHHCPTSPSSKGAGSEPCQPSALAVLLSVPIAQPGDIHSPPQLVPALAPSLALGSGRVLEGWQRAPHTGARRSHRHQKE